MEKDTIWFMETTAGFHFQEKGIWNLRIQIKKRTFVIIN